MFVVKRSRYNPVLAPDREHSFEASSTIGLSPVKHGRKIYALYSAMALPDPSQTPTQIPTIGRTESLDGTNFKKRAQFIVPEAPWEKFGCESPRVTFFEGTYYTFYSALSKYPVTADGSKVAVALSADFEKVSARYLLPIPCKAKAMALFPERINGKVTVIFNIDSEVLPVKMAIAQADTIEELWSVEFWNGWRAEINQLSVDPRRTERDYVEVGAAPIKTAYGWLLVYSHVQNYLGSPNHFEQVFGIETLLLDLNNPRKITGKTRGSLLVPEEQYELAGHIPNAIFPSGAIIIRDVLIFYYDVAGACVCKAKVNFNDLARSLYSEKASDFKFVRFSGNPIITPNVAHAWEAKSTFNPGAIELDKKIHLLYRAFSTDNTSSIGYAITTDGVTIDERLPEPVYAPRESFEIKKIPNMNSGCEDPRLTIIGSRLYMCYTAFDGVSPPRVAATSISVSDFLSRRFNWEKPFLITPSGIDDKDTCILPKKFNGKYLVLHRMGTDICADYLDSLDFKKGEMVNKCIRILGPRGGSWDNAKVGITAPPIETAKGWLLFYHAVSRNHNTYRVGAALLHKKDPTVVLSRSTDPIFEPEEDYEKVGVVNNVVFPCGAIARDGVVYLYYGCADRVIGVATMKLSIILKALENGIR